MFPRENDPTALHAPGLDGGSVSVLGGVVLRGHDQAAALPGPPVHRLDDVDHLLLVFHGPVDLVVVASAQVDHDVLVPAGGQEGVSAHENASEAESHGKHTCISHCERGHAQSRGSATV